MIISKLLRLKKVITKLNGEQLIDLISSTFKFNERTNISLGPVLVRPEESMRPDNLANRIYGESEYWDVILKFNAISNPFSLEEGETLLAPAYTNLRKFYSAPTVVLEKGSASNSNKNETATVNPKTKKDKKRLDSLKKKIGEITPPNVNLTGESNIKIVNGNVIFGSNMTTSQSLNKNNSLTRSRVESQLKNNSNF